MGALLFLRRGGVDLRRPAGPLFDMTFTAAVAASIAGVIIGDARFDPVWPRGIVKKYGEHSPSPSQIAHAICR
ncbi:MAG TPA: hypothetical protein VHV75_10755 [Solirubrobacteraceae bacterium]|nr:hypothetical protein [Solirubrobacteraceae bacterium]